VTEDRLLGRKKQISKVETELGKHCLGVGKLIDRLQLWDQGIDQDRAKAPEKKQKNDQRDHGASQYAFRIQSLLHRLRFVLKHPWCHYDAVIA